MSPANVALPPLAIRITRADVIRYAGAATDFNPIHWSDRHAAALKLPGVIAHGLFTMALALRIVTDWIEDPRSVISYSCRFGRPVFVPDTDEGVELQVNGRVSDVAADKVTIRLHVTVNGAPVLTKVVCEVKPPPPDSAAGRALAAAAAENL
ncbi:MAG: dehydratase [Propionibacteriaceae bacterium]|jgi:acyl dehydratase|nr:dehydratase [Propionibacteriaceae bacterium]